MPTQPEQTTKTTPKWRILVVENEAQTRADHVYNLERWGYQVFTAQGQGQSLLSDARELAKRERCHLALVDMRLLSDDDASDTSGLDLVPELKPTESIVVTGFGDVNTSSEAITRQGALYVISKAREPEALREIVQDKLRELGYTHDIQIEWPRGLDSTVVIGRFFPNDPLVPQDEVDDVLRRLFHTAKERIKLEDLNKDADTFSLTLRPRSIVLRVKVDKQARWGIVKLARTVRVHREVERYKATINELNAMYYAHLRDNPVELWDVGGVVYDFLGADEDNEVNLFTSFYRDRLAPIADIRRALRHLNEWWEPLYVRKPPVPDKLQMPLFEAYRGVWGKEWYDRLVREDKTQMNYPVPYYGPPLPDPVAWLKGRLDTGGNLEDTVMAWTHGDLRGDNFFVDNKLNIWLIDYERTGHGPISQDWIELESDILTRLVNVDLSDFCRLVFEVVRYKRLLLQRCPFDHFEMSRAFQTISAIRTHAYKSSHSRSAYPYLWGLLFNAVFRLTLLEEIDVSPEKEVEKQLAVNRCKLLAGILCYRLEHWSKPQKEWERPLVGYVSGTASRHKKEFGLASAHDYALLIGVGDTPHDPVFSLPTTVKDTEALRNVLVDPARCAFPPQNVRVLSNENASLPRIREELKWLADRAAANPDSTVIVYFSGHGGHLQADDRYFLVPSNIGLDNIEETVLWASEFTERLRSIKANRMLVLIDSCHAAGMATAKDASLLRVSGFVAAPPPDELLKVWQQSHQLGQAKHAVTTLGHREGRVVLSSSRGDQSSYVRKDGTLSIFTYHLLEALRGDASKPDDTVVTVSILISHLGRTVPASAHADWGVQQRPWIDYAGEDFPITSLGRNRKDPPMPKSEANSPSIPQSDSDPGQPITLFYSYSHKDEKLRDRLENHLSILKRQGVISNWHDRRIAAGSEWKGEIDEHLNSARIILLLVSADFLASDYCYDVEMKRALQRHDYREARVIPVILKPVAHARGRTTMDENVLYLYPCGWCKGRNVVGAKSLQVSSTWMPVGTANCGTRPRPGST